MSDHDAWREVATAIAQKWPTAPKLAPEVREQWRDQLMRLPTTHVLAAIVDFRGPRPDVGQLCSDAFDRWNEADRKATGRRHGVLHTYDLLPPDRRAALEARMAKAWPSLASGRATWAELPWAGTVVALIHDAVLAEHYLGPVTEEEEQVGASG